jgi:hypothetical protein
MAYPGFRRIPRWNRDVVITEKIDGTNGQVFVFELPTDDMTDMPSTFAAVEHDGLPYGVAAGSRKRWLSLTDDNAEFCDWVMSNAAELVKLGPGHHYGEWWGWRINRGYDMPKGQRVFSLFNVLRWTKENLEGIEVPELETVPIIWEGNARDLTWGIAAAELLRDHGSIAQPGYGRPEGYVIGHAVSGNLYKVTFENDECGKWSKQQIEAAREAAKNRG